MDLDIMRPLVERYLASLPSLERQESWRDEGVRHVEGVVEDTVYAGIEPQSQTRIYFTGPFDYARQNRTTIRAMALLLQTRLRDVLREELGGTYGVGVGASYAWQPHETYTISINFGSDPDRADELATVVFAEIEKLKEAAPEMSEVTDVQENFTRTFETDSERNTWWMSQIGYKYQRGETLDDLPTYPESIDALSATDIQEAAQRYFNMGNYVRVTLLPEQQQDR
jgi:zinc protease